MLFNPLRKGKLQYSLSGTTLTIAAVGKTLVELPHSSTAGLKVVLDITGKSWTFNPAAYPDSMTNGITDAVNWANAMPWFDYFVNKDNTAANLGMASSRNPIAVVTPAHGNCDFSDGLASTSELQTNFVAWQAHDAAYGAFKCQRIGSHTQTYSYGGVGAREWVIGALADTDGYGKFQHGVQFTLPVGQNGASAASHLSEAGAATSLAFATPSALYTNTDGLIHYWYGTGLRSASDASATALWLASPYAAVGYTPRSAAYLRAATTISIVMATVNTAGPYITFSLAGSTFNVAGFSDASDAIYAVHAIYWAY